MWEDFYRLSRKIKHDFDVPAWFAAAIARGAEHDGGWFNEWDEAMVAYLALRGLPVGEPRRPLGFTWEQRTWLERVEFPLVAVPRISVPRMDSLTQTLIAAANAEPRLRVHRPTVQDFVDPGWIFGVIRNADLRAWAATQYGWDRLLGHPEVRVIHEDPDPSIGKVVDVGGLARYLVARCGTGRWVAIVVPGHCETALEAQAWSYGLPPEEFVPPEVRT